MEHINSLTQITPAIVSQVFALSVAEQEKFVERMTTAQAEKFFALALAALSSR